MRHWLIRGIAATALGLSAQFLTAPKAHAFLGGGIVFDPTNLAQAVSNGAQIIAQLEQMYEDYANQVEQLQRQVEQVEAMTGARALGLVAYEARDYLPEDLASILILDDGSEAAMIRRELEDIFSPITSDPYVSGGMFKAGSPLAEALDRQTNTMLASMAASELAYDEIEKRVASIEELMTLLDGSEDIKTSTDLNGRITAENSLLLAEMMRLQTLQMQMRAAETNLASANQASTFKALEYDAQTVATTIPEIGTN